MGKANRHERQDKPPHTRLTPRDIEVVASVGKFRLLTYEQLQSLHFPSKNTAQRRLRKLFDGKYLERGYVHEVKNNQLVETIYYTLDQQGIELLHALGRRDVKKIGKGKPANSTVWQDIAHSQIQIAFTKGVEAIGAELLAWYDQRELRALTKIRPETLIPDAFFAVRHQDLFYRFFVEHDRGNEALKTLKSKMDIYNGYLDSQFLRQHTTSSPARVLFICEGSKQRISNIAELTLSYRLSGFMWVANLTEIITQSPLTTPFWLHKARPLTALLPTK